MTDFYLVIPKGAGGAEVFMDRKAAVRRRRALRDKGIRSVVRKNGLKGPLVASIEVNTGPL